MKNTYNNLIQDKIIKTQTSMKVLYLAQVIPNVKNIEQEINQLSVINEYHVHLLSYGLTKCKMNNGQETFKISSYSLQEIHEYLQNNSCELIIPSHGMLVEQTLNPYYHYQDLTYDKGIYSQDEWLLINDICQSISLYQNKQQINEIIMNQANWNIEFAQQYAINVTQNTIMDIFIDTDLQEINPELLKIRKEKIFIKPATDIKYFQNSIDYDFNKNPVSIWDYLINNSNSFLFTDYLNNSNNRHKYPQSINKIIVTNRFFNLSQEIRTIVCNGRIISASYYKKEQQLYKEYVVNHNIITDLQNVLDMFYKVHPINVKHIAAFDFALIDNQWKLLETNSIAVSGLYHNKLSNIIEAYI